MEKEYIENLEPKTSTALIVELYSAFHNNRTDNYLSKTSQENKELLLEKLNELKKISEEEDKELESIINLVKESNC